MDSKQLLLLHNFSIISLLPSVDPSFIIRTLVLNFVELINFINSLSNLDKLSFSLNIGTIIVNVDILYFQ